MEELAQKLQGLACESCKENLPPSFRDLLRSSAIQSDELEQQRRKMLEGIHSYVGSDPLKPWVRCIKWAKDLFSSGVKSELLPLLELCTQKFLNDPRYFEDPRYLRVWIRYADCCSDPLSVFSFLQEKKIGQSHSIFYEAYAMLLELRKEVHKADEVYQLGLSRQAQPIAQLQDMYKKFVKRKEQILSTSTVCVGGAQRPDTVVLPQRTVSQNPSAEPHGDETIAIKKYAEEAIVIGVDPDAAEQSKECHYGLVDPTINTKEAVVNVLSFFSQPLPLEQVRRGSRKETRPKAPAGGGSDLDVFVDDAFSENAGNGFSICADQPLSFEVFEDESAGPAPSFQDPTKGVDPWDDGLIGELLKGLKPSLSTYEGFHHTSKKFNGSIPLATQKNSCRNKIVDLGNSSYCVKGCTGQGAFAQVFQAYDDRCEKTVILKIQKPPCPWEFYIYRQLDKRIPSEERSSFGYAWKMHVFSDCSIMVADYVQHGTLQDVINTYFAQNQKMDELLCIYYTIELLRMLEVLHSQGIIHGDFKPDNLLIRNESTEWQDWAPERPGCWRDQGLCLIDWGRSIDLSLFPSGTEFTGDCRTSAFRCIEMVRKRPWTFQVDTYGLCGIVHCMLHGTYMKVEEDKSGRYKPKAPFRRYWNVSLWDSLFKALLNVPSCDGNPPLRPLRASFEHYLLSNPSQAKKLKEVLMKQSVVMYSRK